MVGVGPQTLCQLGWWGWDHRHCVSEDGGGGTTDTVSEDGGGGTTDTVLVRMMGVGPQTLCQ